VTKQYSEQSEHPKTNI